MNGNLKLGIKNFLMVGLMSVLFIVMFKVITTKYNVAGLSTIAQTV